MTAQPSSDEAQFSPSQSPTPAAVETTLLPGAALRPHAQENLGECLRHKQAALAEELVTRQYLMHPEVVRHYGPAGHDECLADAHYHLSYLADAMNAQAPELYTHYVAWAKVMLGKRGMPADCFARHLEVTRMVVKEMLEGEAGAVATEYIGWGLARMPAMPAELPTYLRDTEPHAELAREYITALLKGDRHLASQGILHAVGTGVTVKDIYLHVFQPAQYEIGRLWQLNELSVAQEHYCTAATQWIMSQLYSYILASEKAGGTLVSTCVAGGLHEIGLRMVTDFFEIDGWDTFYLGANMPAQAVVETVAQRKAHILCISATTSSCLEPARGLIQRVRADPGCRDVKILVGGSPCQVAPALWRTMNADGTASNAQEALVLANHLIARKPPRGYA